MTQKEMASLGGQARRDSLTPERIREIASLAGSAPKKPRKKKEKK